MISFKKLKATDIALIAVCSAIMFVSQVAMSFLPNIEVVSLLTVVFSKHFRKKTLAMIYVFAGIEGLCYGFGIWWLNYLYVWTILYFASLPFITTNNTIVLSVVLGLFGLFFGTLCSVPYFFTLGFSGGISYIVNGIPFDLMHCAGNFVTCLLLFKPLDRVIAKTDSIIK